MDDFDTDWGHFFAGGEGGFVTRNTWNTWKKYNFRDSDGGLKLTSKMGMNSSAIVDLTPFLDNITAYDLARVKFHWYARSFENDEDYFVELCADGLTCEASSSWQVLGQYERCCTPEQRVSGTRGCKTQTTCDFNNDESGFKKIDLPKPIGGNPHLRIRMDASGTGDQLIIDNVELQVRGTGEHAPSSAPSQSPTTNECTVDNGGCDQLCTDLTGEADPRECGCYDNGFVLGEDGTTCLNVNECDTGEHQCAQLCSDLTPDPIDTGLRYECGCEEGYRLVSDDPAETQCEVRRMLLFNYYVVIYCVLRYIPFLTLCDSSSFLHTHTHTHTHRMSTNATTVRTIAIRMLLVITRLLVAIPARAMLGTVGTARPVRKLMNVSLAHV